MALTLREPNKTELPFLSDLCLRSKAHWGYDAEFIEACRDVLSITEADLARDHIVVAEQDGEIVGVVHVQEEGSDAILDKLFIEPNAIGGGVGKSLYAWAEATARNLGAANMKIDSDPQAEAFYVKMGAKTIGRIASTAVEGRTLPLMSVSL